MDIIIPIVGDELIALMNDRRDFHKQPGWHFHVCWKRPKKAYTDDRLFFHHDNKIMGYTEILSVMKIDDEVQTTLAGQLWQHKNKIIITWLQSKWYKMPIEYIMNVKLWRFKYFDLKKCLGDRKEPGIINQEALCQQKIISQKEAQAKIKKLT